MRISIIVPAFNEERLLAASLAAIRNAADVFAARGWAHELIICDNNSTDRTAAIARSAGAQVVFEPVNQIARARNTGAAAASGNWLLFIDADSHPDPSLFAEVAERIESGRVLGGFSHDWFAGEELEFCQRLKTQARKTRRRIVILHRHPIHTSGRKMDLYTPWETLWMLTRAAITCGRSLRSRETTHLWYDGRR